MSIRRGLDASMSEKAKRRSSGRTEIASEQQVFRTLNLSDPAVSTPPLATKARSFWHHTHL